MARDLPIFPLNVVLFPGTPQPLHIFEPRYRALLDDSLEHDGVFGISYVEPGRSLDPVPAPGSVGCIAQIRSVSRLADGRANILTVGGDRYELLTWIPADRPYRLGRVEPFADDRIVEAEVDELAATVRTGYTTLAGALGTLQDQAPQALEVPGDPEALSFHVAAALPIDPAHKLELQRTRSTHGRLEALDHLLRRLNSGLRERVAVHHRARRNGRGGRSPDIVRQE